MKYLPRRRFRVLVLALAAAAITGCGGSENEPAPPAANPASTEPGGSAATSDTLPTAPPATPPETLRTELAPFFDLIREGRTGPARVRVRKHLNLHPEDGQAHFLFGLSYHREKQYVEAEPYFADGRRFSPAFPPVHYFSGWCAYYRGALDDARAHFERYLELLPDVSDAWFGLGVIAYDQDRGADADAAFARALECVSDDDPQRDRQRSKINARWAELVIDQGDLPRRARDARGVRRRVFPINTTRGSASRDSSTGSAKRMPPTTRGAPARRPRSACAAANDAYAAVRSGVQFS